MSYQAENAVILAAGLSSRFAPISYEMPKALIPVRGEVLIERQIRQLREAGIDQVIVVTGYKAEMFEYLKEKLGVILVHNREYQEKNNHSSIYAVREYLKNTYICCGDNYFNINPFEKNVEQSYYSALYAVGETDEWCMETDGDGIITSVKIGGRDAWYMNGPVFWSEEFSRTFLDILEVAYGKPQTADKMWENIYLENIDSLPLKLRKYDDSVIYEFDSLEELREFDGTYKEHSGSRIMEYISKTLGCREGDIYSINPAKNADGSVSGIQFLAPGGAYQYDYAAGSIVRYAMQGSCRS